MVIFITKSLETIRQKWDSPFVGRLIQPRTFGLNTLQTCRSGIDWAADNDCFNPGWHPRGFVRMLGEIAHGPSMPRFVTVPDVVGDANQTLISFNQWAPVMLDLGIPIALVGQDGMEYMDIPWDMVQAFFIGGTDAFKLGPGGAMLARKAKTRQVGPHGKGQFHQANPICLGPGV